MTTTKPNSMHMPILIEHGNRESHWFGLCSYYFVANFKMGCKHLFNLIAPVVSQRETINQSWHSASSYRLMSKLENNIFFSLALCAIIMRGCASSYGVISHMLVVGNGIYLFPTISRSSTEQPFHISTVIPSGSWRRRSSTLFTFYKS